MSFLDLCEQLLGQGNDVFFIDGTIVRDFHYLSQSVTACELVEIDLACNITTDTYWNWVDRFDTSRVGFSGH